MAPAELWAPLDAGAHASVWLPGGAPIAFCSLSPAEDINMVDVLFGDNFTGSAGTALQDHIPDFPAELGWGALDNNGLEISNSNVTNPLAGTSCNYVYSLDAGVQPNVDHTSHLAVYDEHALFNASISLRLYSNEQRLTTWGITFARLVENGPIIANGIWDIADSTAGTTPPLNASYCQWMEVTTSVNLEGGSVNMSFLVNGEQQDQYGGFIIGELSSIVRMEIDIVINNVVANTVRIADTKVVSFGAG